MSNAEAPTYKIIEGSLEWADKYREFCRKAYMATYIRPELGITKDLFTKEIFSSPRIIKLFQCYCNRTENHKSWLAVDSNNELLGVVAADLHPDYCDMKAFYVKPELRGHGIGHELYSKVLDFAGSLPIQVDVIEYVTETIEMYKHWGFEVDEAKGTLIYNMVEWPEQARQAYRAIYMVKPGNVKK